MIIDCKKGKYIVDTNFRDAFRLDVFEEKYIEECFDKYIYIYLFENHDLNFYQTHNNDILFLH